MYKKLTSMGCDAPFKYIQHIAGLTSDNTVERNDVRSCQCIGLNGPYKQANYLTVEQDVYPVRIRRWLRRKNPSSPNRSRTNDLLVTSPDALPLSYRRLVGAKATYPGSCHKNPAYCYDWNVDMCWCAIGSLSKDVFEQRTSTGSEDFSLVICLDAM